MNTIKNALIGLLLMILVIILPMTVYFGKSHFALSAQVDSLKKNSNFLATADMESDHKTAKGITVIDRASTKNRYILNNDKSQALVDLRAVCEQKNGILCVTKENEKLKFIGCN